MICDGEGRAELCLLTGSLNVQFVVKFTVLVTLMCSF